MKVGKWHSVSICRPLSGKNVISWTGRLTLGDRDDDDVATCWWPFDQYHLFINYCILVDPYSMIGMLYLVEGQAIITKGGETP